jgi:hypothetical protein
MRLIGLLLLVFINSYSFASISLNSLSQSEFKNISEEFSANFTHTVVAPASSLGKIFGFEVGVMAGAIDSESLKDLVKQAGGDDMSYIPHAGITGQLSIPFGITLEANLLPSVDLQDFEYSVYSLGARWTFTDSIKVIPLSIAARVFYTTAELGYTQAVSGGSSNVTFSDSIYGLTVLASKDFIFIEPYVGFGIVEASAKMEYSGSSSIFNFTSSKSETADFSGTQLIVGAKVSLLLFKIAAEYTQVLERSKYSLKLAVGF